MERICSTKGVKGLSLACCSVWRSGVQRERRCVYFTVRYMLEILPNTDWSQELVRPALNLILRRLDRLFTKISKKAALRVRMAVVMCEGLSL